MTAAALPPVEEETMRAPRTKVQRDGRTKTRTYRIWSGIRTRTTNTRHHSSKNYIPKGIDYDPRWEDYAAFLADMGECPDGHSIDRKDNNSGYWPWNCRWATRAVQQRNTSRNVHVVLRGRDLVLKDALCELGYSYQAYYYLARKYKFSPQEAIDRFCAAPKLADRRPPYRRVG